MSLGKNDGKNIWKPHTKNLIEILARMEIKFGISWVAAKYANHNIKPHNSNSEWYHHTDNPKISTIYVAIDLLGLGWD